MSDTTVDPTGAARVRALETEVRALQLRVAQREAALAILNRRLLKLEVGSNGVDGMARAETGALAERSHQLEEELDNLKSTKLFRWSNPARDVYGRYLRVRRSR